ncbi:MAG: alanine--glyoxylate aminotransferase family protein [Parcubacteria group bacterium]|nr:alanine--glyoxylate aminotransferase family protein [Parcubacteria group bacterium]
MIFFTPGPSQLFPTIPKHLREAMRNDIMSIPHRSDAFREIYKETAENLKKFLGIPETHSILFVASATEAMERIIENTIKKKSAHFVNGVFSERFFQIAVDLKKEPQEIKAPPGKGFNFSEIPALQKDIELVCFTHCETSTGVMLAMEDIESMATQNPEKIIAIDVVSSFPYAKIDYNAIDLVFFSVQKGFGLPAGLGVIIASPRSIEKARALQKKGFNVGSYHTFPTLVEYAEKYMTNETPNVLAIYLLGKVAKDMDSIGIEKIRHDTEKKADMLYEFLSHNSLFSPFIEEKKCRSRTIITVKTKKSPVEIISTLKQKGLWIGVGYKPFENEQLRIANFPTTRVKDMKNLIEKLSNFIA